MRRGNKWLTNKAKKGFPCVSALWKNSLILLHKITMLRNPLVMMFTLPVPISQTNTKLKK